MATFRTSQPDSAADPSLPHLVLVGLPGSGKSTVGAILGKQLGRTFLDFDHEIVRRQGMTIAEIFGMHGEHRFRELELELTKELLEFGNMILAPGGGWIGQADAVSLLRPRSRMFYLRSRPATALRRMGGSKSKRPLLMRPDPLGELDRLLAARKAAYESAQHVVDVEHLAPQQIADRIVAVLAATKPLGSGS
jgi:shikimate kinase